MANIVRAKLFDFKTTGEIMSNKNGVKPVSSMSQSPVVQKAPQFYNRPMAPSMGRGMYDNVKSQ